MTFAAILFIAGLMLSAFFSGSETGLYRVSRTKLVLDGLSGSPTARAMIWFLNNPTIFVATTLIGNNIANYVTSLAIVIAVAIQFSDNATAELIAPMLLTPIVFVFGELLPKHLFYHAPHRLLKSTRLFFIAAAVLFAPITIFLSVLGVVLRLISGQTPFQLRLGMARSELDQVLRAGQEAGILVDGQRQLTRRLFEIGNEPAMRFGVPPQRFAHVQDSDNATTAVTRAHRANHPIVLVTRRDKIVGFVHCAELICDTPQLKPKAVVVGKTTDRHLKVLLDLYDHGSDVAVLKNERGDVKTVVTRRQLLNPLTKPGEA